jgi:DNA primase
MIPPELDFRHLKQVVSIEQVLAHKAMLDGLRLRGHCLVGPCPIHGGDNPRAFVVDRHKGLWHCFTGCGAGGDVVELVRRLDRLSYLEAARSLASLRRWPPPLRPPPPPAATMAFRPFTVRLSLDPTARLLRDKGILPRTAKDFEVGAWHGRGMLAGCVAFRLRRPTGQPLGYAGRRTSPEVARRRGKWVFPPRLPKSELLYGLFQVFSHLDRGLVVVEDPWSVLRLAQLRIPSVALLGTHISDIQKHWLLRAPRIVLMMDGDEAGRRAALSIRQALDSRIETFIVDLPDGKDPDDLDDNELCGLSLPFFPS